MLNLKQIQEHFSKNNKVLMHIQNSPKDATILEKNAIATVAIAGIFIMSLLVGRNVGLQSILSLIFNTGAILIAIAMINIHLLIYSF